MSVDDIRARRAAITPGVWNDVFSRVNVEGTDIAITRLGAQGEADATFIAAAPADIDTLLAEVKRLTWHAEMATEQANKYLAKYEERVSRVTDLNKQLAALTAERDALAAQLAQAQRELAQVDMALMDAIHERE